jgi:hypothetical protein
MSSTYQFQGYDSSYLSNKQPKAGVFDEKGDCRDENGRIAVRKFRRVPPIVMALAGRPLINYK